MRKFTFSFVNGVGEFSIEVQSNLDSEIMNNNCVFRRLNSDIVSNSTFTRYEYFPSSSVVLFFLPLFYFFFCEISFLISPSGKPPISSYTHNSVQHVMCIYPVNRFYLSFLIPVSLNWITILCFSRTNVGLTIS
jgi:hypothetical protein